MRYKAKILGHEGYIVGTLESSANDGFNDMIKDDSGNIEYIDVTTIENISGNKCLNGTSNPLNSVSTFRWWDVYEVLPKGWKIDNTTGSPLHGYDFCTDGKSILNGGKRALVRSIRKGTPLRSI